jgi:hypothetical protein
VSLEFSQLIWTHASARLGAAFENGENAAGVGLNTGW